MEIKRVEENDRIGEFINVAFSEYATDCDVALNCLVYNKNVGDCKPKM